MPETVPATGLALSLATAQTPSADERFHFDVAGYLHLRGVVGGDELATVLAWAEETARIDVAALNADRGELIARQLNRPVSRIFDADQRFLRYLDDARVHPYLVDFLGDHRHIDSELYDTRPGYAGGPWHRGVARDDTGHVRHGTFLCPMVKVFWCLTAVGPGQGEFVLVPGSHRAQMPVDLDRIDLPGQRIFDDVHAGDVIIFNEACLHTGRPNPSRHTRKTLIFNYGRADAGTWPGYAPAAATLAVATPRQRRILANGDAVWQEPVLP